MSEILKLKVRLAIARQERDALELRVEGLLEAAATFEVISDELALMTGESDPLAALTALRQALSDARKASEPDMRRTEVELAPVPSHS